MTLKDLGGIFLVHLGLSVLALTGALWNYFQTKRREPERELRPLNLEMPVAASFRWTSNQRLDVVGGSGTTVTASTSNKSKSFARKPPNSSDFRWQNTRPPKGSNYE